MQLHETPMGRKFYEATMPQIAEALSNIAKELKTVNEADAGIDTSQLKDPYVRLDIPDTNLYVQVKLDDEGVAVDIFRKPKEPADVEESIASAWKLYQEMADFEMIKPKPKATKKSHSAMESERD